MQDFKRDDLSSWQQSINDKCQILRQNRSDVEYKDSKLINIPPMKINNVDIQSEEAYNSRNVDNSEKLQESPNSSLQNTMDKYLTKLKQNCKRYLDNIYGVYKQGNMLMIGNAPIQVENNHVKVNDVSYAITEGFLELLFKRNPNENLISSDDIANYHKIIKDTSAHKIRYHKDEPIRKLKSHKFNKFIASLCNSTFSDRKQLLPRYDKSQHNSNNKTMDYNANILQEQDTSAESEEEYSEEYSEKASEEDRKEPKKYQSMIDESNRSSRDFKNIHRIEIKYPTTKDLDFRGTKLNSQNLHSTKRKYVNTDGTALSPSFKRFKKAAPIDYEDWDDPNELVDRLRLLVAEQSAGNLSHFLEIQTILKELHEAGYIY